MPTTYRDALTMRYAVLVNLDFALNQIEDMASTSHSADVARKAIPSTAGSQGSR